MNEQDLVNAGITNGEHRNQVKSEKTWFWFWGIYFLQRGFLYQCYTYMTLIWITFVDNFTINNIHENNSQFWLAESSAILRKQTQKNGNTVQKVNIFKFHPGRLDKKYHINARNNSSRQPSQPAYRDNSRSYKQSEYDSSIYGQVIIDYLFTFFTFKFIFLINRWKMSARIFEITVFSFIFVADEGLGRNRTQGINISLVPSIKHKIK